MILSKRKRFGLRTLMSDRKIQQATIFPIASVVTRVSGRKDRVIVFGRRSMSSARDVLLSCGRAMTPIPIPVTFLLVRECVAVPLVSILETLNTVFYASAVKTVLVALASSTSGSIFSTDRIPKKNIGNG